MFNRVTGKLTARALTAFLLLSLINGLFLVASLVVMEIAERSLDTQRNARQATLCVAQFSADLQDLTARCLDSICFKGARERRETARTFPLAKSKFRALKMELEGYPEVAPLLERMGVTMDSALSYTRQLAAIKLMRPGAAGKPMFNEYAFRVIQCSNELGSDLVSLEEKFRNLEKNSPASILTNQNASIFLFLGILLAGGLSTFLGVRIWTGLLRSISERLAEIEKTILQITAGKFETFAAADPPARGRLDEIARLESSLLEAARQVELAKSVETLIIEAANNFICLLDDRLVILQISERSSLLIGHSAEDLIGKRFASLLPKDDVHSFSESMSALKTNFLCRIICGDGSVSTFNFSAAMTEGGSYAISGFDITLERQRELQLESSERQYRRLFDVVPVAVLTTDEELRITSANAYTESMSGRQADELVGLPLQELVSGVDNVISGKDGQRTFVEVIKVSYRDKQNRYLICLNDVSAQMAVELAKRDFVNMIGHDIRSPLMAVDGTIALLKQGLRQEQGMQGQDKLPCLQEAEAILAQLIRLLNDFLSTGKLECGQNFLSLEAVSLENFAHDLYGYLSSFGLSVEIISESSEQPSAWTAGGHAIKLSYPAGASQSIAVDSENLPSTILDLILILVWDLALEADKSLHLRLTVERGEQRIKLKISALGQISTRLKDAKSRLLDDSMTFLTVYSRLKARPLSGLSFALAHAIVNGHDGQITLESVGKEQGLTISLPIA